MGITSFSKTLLEGVIWRYTTATVLELGAQNLYDQPNLPAPYARVWYESLGIQYTAFDMSGEDGSIIVDLSNPIPVEYLSKYKFDLVTDFGTAEHIGKEGKHNTEAFYNCWKTKHDLLAVNGIMVNENPLTGNWPGHGFNYHTEKFYQQLIELMGYKLISLSTHPAMGNITDGWNVYCVFQKTEDKEFISLDKFSKLDYRLS